MGDPARILPITRSGRRVWLNEEKREGAGG